MTEFLEQLRLGDKWIILPIIFKLTVTYVRKKRSSLEMLKEVRFSMKVLVQIFYNYWLLELATVLNLSVPSCLLMTVHHYRVSETASAFFLPVAIESLCSLLDSLHLSP